MYLALSPSVSATSRCRFQATQRVQPRDILFAMDVQLFLAGTRTVCSSGQVQTLLVAFEHASAANTDDSSWTAKAKKKKKKEAEQIRTEYRVRAHPCSCMYMYLLDLRLHVRVPGTVGH